MSVLVLGGAGYIGSHTVRALIDAGRDVVVADNLLTGFRAAVHPKAKFYELDIRDRAALDNLFENSSMVAHGVDKIVFSSTAATYGEPERIPILETDKTEPTNCYGETKLSMEKMMKWTSVAHGLHYVALRYFNACGAQPDGSIGEAHDPETHLIPLILQVPNGKRASIAMFGTDYPTKDGTCVRDYIHVCDLASAHILALDYLLKSGENNVFNLGNGVGFTVREVIDVARDVTGHPIPADECPRRAGDPAQLVASSEKARTVLGWDPKFADLKTIIETAWNWHVNHPNGYGE